jgi:hypothetical protein
MLWVNLGVKGSRVQILSARPTLTQVTAEADVERHAIEPPRQGRMTAALDAVKPGSVVYGGDRFVGLFGLGG